MPFLSIYLTIAAIAFFVILGYFGQKGVDSNVFSLAFVSLIASFLWPAILFGVLFDLAEKRP